MQDRELVAAIVAGDPGGLAEAYDRYAAPLYTYCRFMLPDPRPPAEPADAVADTFIIATVKLPGLRDPDQLGRWLHAVTRNECLRQTGPVEPPADGAMPEVSPPASLRKRVLEECADNTPTGRAHRVSVAHRAGPFGPTGFPKPITPPGPRWWHEVRRHPRAAAGVAALAAAVVVAGAATLLLTGGQHRAQASTVALGGGDFATSSAAPSPVSGVPSTPSRRPTPVTRASATATDTPDAGSSTLLLASRSPAPVRSSPGPEPSRSPSPAPSPSPSPSPSPPPPPPTPGTLRATPKELVLSAVKGKPASGTFILTAVGGPVHFTITSPNAKVTVSPASGSLGSAGSWATVTVTVRSLVAVNAHVIVNPGNLVITVVFSIKA
jgi:hypothetical protein